MQPLSDRLRALDDLLAPYATKNIGSGTRRHPEDEDDVRSAFQRDRARIIHSQAFRRLAGKTQVFVAGQGDHYRTRLTHTMEVAQISRDLARAMGLNEDLTECIALAHDLGHPPFGHVGEAAIDAWMKQHGSSFEHNLQSYRIVTILETRVKDVPGLNLTQAVENGLLKHGGSTLEGVQVTLSVESELVNMCDEIAYTAHDCDDGLRAGLFHYEELQQIPFMKRAADMAQERGLDIRGVIVNMLARDLLTESARTVGENGRPVIAFSQETREALTPFRTFLWDNMYQHPFVTDRSQTGKRVLIALCDFLAAQPNDRVLELQKRTGGTLTDAVKDYVAGMTDGFALRTAEERGLR